MSKGLFITLEGGEGAGKSTLIRHLAEQMEKEGHELLITREPGGSPLGEKVRSLLLESKEPIDSRAELLLFLAARADHVTRIIDPALSEGKLVLCDRFTHSTLAYQGYGRGLDLNELRRLCSFASHDLTPDLTLFLDVPVAVGIERREKRSAADRMEREESTFHEKVRAGFLDLAKAGGMEVIDASASPTEVAQTAWRHIEPLL